MTDKRAGGAARRICHFQKALRRKQCLLARPLEHALTELAKLEPQPVIRDQLARADVIAFLRARADAAADDEGRELYASLERAIAVREMPERGPLAEPDLWAIETRLDTGNVDNILEAVEAVERPTRRTGCASPPRRCSTSASATGSTATG